MTERIHRLPARLKALALAMTDYPGETYKELAHRMGVKPYSLGQYATMLYAILGVNTRTEAILIVVANREAFV